MMMLLFAVSALAQAPAAKPGPEHKKLEIWVGDWTYEDGKSGFSAKPILGGFFVELRGEGNPGWHEIDGYDPVSKKFFWNNFDSSGGFQLVTYTIDGTTVSYTGTEVSGGKQYKIRGTIVLAPDFMSFLEKREMSVDGKAWMPGFETKATKVKSSPK